MSSLLIHVGYHKTGSTWLQKLVFRNARLGFVRSFDKSTEIKDLLIAPNPLDFDPEIVRTAFTPRIEEAEGDGVVPVLTSERLSGNPHSGGYDSLELAKRLDAAFPGSRVLIVIREQRSMVLSAYKQYVKGGGARSLAGYLDPPRGGKVPGFSFDHFAYHRLAGRYRELFGSDRVRVLPFELFASSPREFVGEVIDFAGAAADPAAIDELAFTRKPRRGDTGAVIEVKRRLNRLFVTDDLNPSPLIPSRRVDRAIKRHTKRLNAVVPRSVSDRLDERSRRLVERVVGSRYAQSNRETAALTGLDLSALGYVVDGDPVPTLDTRTAA